MCHYHPSYSHAHIVITTLWHTDPIINTILDQCFHHHAPSYHQHIFQGKCCTTWNHCLLCSPVPATIILSILASSTASCSVYMFCGFLFFLYVIIPFSILYSALTLKPVLHKIFKQQSLSKPGNI